MASIILKWKKFGTTRTLSRAGRLTKPSNRGRRASVIEMTKNLKVTLSELQRSCVEMGETSGRTTITATLHWSGLYALVARRKPLLSERQIITHMEFAKKPPKDSQIVRNKIIWYDENNIKLFVWRWSMGVFFSGRDRRTGQGWGKAERGKVQRYP